MLQNLKGPFIFWIVFVSGTSFFPSFSSRAEEIPSRPALITPKTEEAIIKGLAYLGSTQSRDGSWRANGRYGGAYPCAMTSLAGLALLAGGSTPVEGKYAVNVRKAVEYILSSANRNGLIARMGEEQRPMYGHGFSMLFLGQVYGMEIDESMQKRIKLVLTRAVRLTGKSQSAAGGWLYTPDSNGDEGSVTVTQIQGLRSCKNAGIKVPKSVIQKACNYIEKCANSDGGIAYSMHSRGSSRPAITAAAIATLYNAGEYDNPVAFKALEYMKKYMKKGGVRGRFGGGHNSYLNFYLAMGMYLSSEENWKSYFPKYRDQLLKSQDGDGGWQGDHVGKVYGTSQALIVLQLPYKYLPILQR